MIQSAWQAVARGADVYAFLAGIMALSETARYCGVFEWIAGGLVDNAGNSRRRLFFLVYALGTLVTAALSNDTTAVVLTPAIAAALRRTGAPALPYLYVCAFVANAASFVLPISNPANLVVFDSHLPPLLPWLRSFGLSSLAAIVLTFAVMWLLFRVSLRGDLAARSTPHSQPHAARALAALLLAASVLALVVAAAMHGDIGIVALGSAALSLAVVAARDRRTVPFVLRHIAWHVIALVAVLFIAVSAIDRAGGLSALRWLFAHENALVAGSIVAVLDNLINNLPVALAAGTALSGAAASSSPAMLHAAVVAVDLGPNVAISGSLATLLWQIALRRDGVRVTFLQFLGTGAAVTVPALIAALLLVR